ncbi:NADPH-dependent ferric siderophore reductase [Sphingomonas leidyi]|uniref:NADPH-dependent ferric siderophore reductase n=1 Tax=Sphingomonas leidyi TaxID=68569 RepID=A0A7X5UVK1_9SPHN|nr:SIP domain-containing protein [Sphingomonas leidyi]NIJ63099.1 NADPH-dependent ferric siderophore reductase [Sphingomonas leidyi]
MHVAWTPGQKIQIAMGSAFVARTYTPTIWNAAEGRTCILGYAHGMGPDSDCLRAATPGSSCDIFGPRVSLDIRHPSGPLAIFGDEISLGLAHALAQSGGIEAVTGFFEIGDVEASSSVATQLDLQNYALVGRKAEDAHLSEFESRLSALADAGATLVLTGKAGCIQRIRRTLKALDVPSQRIRTKAYWTPGKTGLGRASRPTRTARLPVPQIRFVSASGLFPLPPAVVLEADRPLRPKFRRSAKRSPSMYSVSPASA